LTRNADPFGRLWVECGFSACIYGALRRFVLVGTIEPITVARRCLPDQGPQGARWCPFGKLRTLLFTASSEPINIHLCLELEA
jgi:hypothetical protein